MLEYLIKQYYAFRGYSWPTATQALLFLISEVGELAEAHLAATKDELSPADVIVLQDAVVMGQRADAQVSGQEAWVRNNDRVKAPDLGDEIADVVMMTTVYAVSVKKPVIGSLTDKLKKKGFDVTTALWGDEKE